MPKDNLEQAKRDKNDEFYTQYEDIQKEISAYLEYDPDIFKGKTVLLPCDDPEWSNFTKFFAQNFETFGLRKLISTSFAADSKINMLAKIKEDVEVVIVINAGDIEKNKVRGDLGITYDMDVLRLIDAFRGYGLFIGSVVLTKFQGQPNVITFTILFTHLI